MQARGQSALSTPGARAYTRNTSRMPGLESGLTLVYLDPVGSGDSDRLPDGDYSVSRYVRFAEAVLDDIGAPSGYFLGHSHGGFVALQFGINHPDRLERTDPLRHRAHERAGSETGREQGDGVLRPALGRQAGGR